MSLEGLRAWIAEVERKLGMRTRVFLVLSVIALGGAGAAIYLAIDARESSVSESDVQALQERLEARIAGGGATNLPEEAAEPETPEPEPQPKPESGGDDGAEDSGGVGTGPPGGTQGGGASAPGGASRSKARELFERAKEEAERAAEQSAGP